MYITDYQIDNYKFEGFNEVSTWDELLLTNLKFIKGEIDHTLYHAGPLDKETEPLKEILYEINRRGFFTIGGQPSCIIECGDLQEKYGRAANTITYQRGYIEGFFNDKVVGCKFIDYIKKRNDCYYLINEFTNDTMKTNTNMEIQINEENYIRHNVTYWVNQITKKETYYTHINQFYGSTNKYNYMNYINGAKYEYDFVKDLYYIVLTTLDYNEKFSVESVIFEFLKQVENN